jgi:hypothetical protein
MNCTVVGAVHDWWCSVTAVQVEVDMKYRIIDHLRRPAIVFMALALALSGIIAVPGYVSADTMTVSSVTATTVTPGVSMGLNIVFTPVTTIQVGGHIYVTVPVGLASPTITGAQSPSYVTINGYASASANLLGESYVSPNYQFTWYITTATTLPAGVPVTLNLTQALGMLGPAAGSYSVPVSDDTDQGSGTFLFGTGAGGLTNVAVSISPTSAGVPVTWTLSFTTSAVGLLTGGTDSIYVDFPSSVATPSTLPTLGSSILVQAGYYTLPATSAVMYANRRLSILVPYGMSVPASTPVTLTLGSALGIPSPATSGTHMIQVSTSKDLASVSASLTISSTGVSNAGVTVDPASVGAAANYDVTFTLSSGGALASTDRIYLTFGTSTSLPAVIAASSVLVGGNAVSSVQVDSLNRRIGLQPSSSIVGGSTVTVHVDASAAVRNPSQAGTYPLYVSTSHDAAAVMANYAISASSTKAGTVTVSPALVSVAGTYVVTFTTGGGGALGVGDTISLTFPSDTTLPATLPAASVAVNTSFRPSSVVTSVAQRTVVMTMPTSFGVSGDQQVTIVIDRGAGIHNPTTQNKNLTLKIHTSKEPTDVTTSAYAVFGAPTTSLKTTPGAPDGSNGYYVTRPQFSIVLDNPSGAAAQVFVKVGDGSSYQVYTTGSLISIPDGSTTVSWYAQDSQGNKEQEHLQKFLVDTVPPVLNVTAPVNGATAFTSDVKVEGTMAGGTVLTVNGTATTLDATGHFSTTVSVSGDGDHSIVIVGRDDPGNTVTRTVVVRYISRVTMLLQVGNVNAYINNVQQAIEAPPFISGGRAMIPLRFVSQMFKASVAWDSIFQIVTLTLNGKTIRVQVGNRRGDVGGKAVTLDVAPALIRGTVYVPIRFISENFGALVTWDAKMQVVNIIYPKP